MEVMVRKGGGGYFTGMKEDEMSLVRDSIISEYDLSLQRKKKKELKLSLNHQEIIYHFY